MHGTVLTILGDLHISAAYFELTYGNLGHQFIQFAILLEIFASGFYHFNKLLMKLLPNLLRFKNNQ